MTVPFGAQFVPGKAQAVTWKFCYLSNLSVVPIAEVNTAKNSVPETQSILHWPKLLKNIANRCNNIFTPSIDPTLKLVLIRI